MEKKIKSAEELMISYLLEVGMSELTSSYYIAEFVKVMKIYAAQAIEAQLEIAAEEAEIIDDQWYEAILDKDSIRNCTRINLE